MMLVLSSSLFDIEGKIFFNVNSYGIIIIKQICFDYNPWVRKNKPVRAIRQQLTFLNIYLLLHEFKNFLREV